MDLGGFGGGGSGGGSGDKATSSASSATSGNNFGGDGGMTPLIAVALAGVLIFGFLGFLYIVKK